MKRLFSRLAGYTDSTYFSTIFLAVLLALSFAIGFFKLAAYDLWWHLKTGELILSSGIPKTDPFSFTAFGNHWVTHEWLAEVFLYLIHKLGGNTALIAFKGLVSAALAYILFRIGQRNGVFAPLSAAVSLFAIAGVSYMMYARPHAFSYLFLAIELYLLFRVSRSEKAFFRERWVVLPAILMVWANMHAGFILGIGVYWVVAARETLLPYAKDLKFAGRLKRFILPALFGTLVCLINPNGYEVFTYPLLIAGNPVFKSTISEWVSPLYLGPTEWVARYFLYIASALGIWAIIRHLKRRPEISIIILVVGASAWIAMRNIQNFAIVLAAALLAETLVPAVKRINVFKNPIVKPALTLASLAWMIVWFGLIRDYQAENGRLGSGIKQGLVPIEAAAFLNEVGFEGNIVNVLSDGGYLIWAGYPRWKVFVDGRLDVYGEAQITNYRKIIEGQDGTATIDELGADAAVLPMPPGLGSLRKTLSWDQSWALVHFDDYYLVYMKRNPKNEPIVERWAYKIINPIAPGYGLSDTTLLDSFTAEAERAIARLPEAGVTNSIYALAMQQRRDFAGATEHLKEALGAQPKRLSLVKSVAESFARAGEYDSARVWFLSALEIQPKDASIYFSLGMLSAIQKDYDTAEKYFNDALERDPGSPAAQMLEKIRAIRGQQE